MFTMSLFRGVRPLAGLLLVLGSSAPCVLGQVLASSPASQAVDVQSAPAPRITVGENVHDFGTVWAGTKLEHSFKITNAGSATLEIKEVRPGCSCTTVGSSPKSLKPGESGMFPFVLDTTTVFGEFTRFPTIVSNDEAVPLLVLQLKGAVKRVVDVIPPVASFGSVYGGTPRTMSLKITNNGEKPLVLALDPFASEEGSFRFELTETTPGKAFDLKVTAMMPFSTPGVKQAIARMMTNLASQRDLVVTATVVVRDRLDIYPSALVILPSSDRATTTGTSTRLLSFTNSGPNPVSLVEATSDEPLFQVSIQPQEAGKTYLVRVDMPSDYAVPPEGRKIIVKTDDAAKPVLIVPVAKAFVPPAASAPSPVASAPATPKPAPQFAEKLVGQQVPDFRLTTLAGRALSPSELKGKVAILNLVSSRCNYCKKQLPRMEALMPPYEAKGVQYVLIGETMGEGEETNDMFQAALKELNVKADIAVDAGNRVGGLFEAAAFPTMVILGRTGRVEAVNMGNKANLEDLVKGQLDSLLEGRPIPDRFPPQKEHVSSTGAVSPAS